MLALGPDGRAPSGARRTAIDRELRAPEQGFENRLPLGLQPLRRELASLV